MKQSIQFTLFFLSVSCFTDLSAQEKDTVMYQRDSAIILPTSQTVLFFQQAEQPANPEKIMVINKAGKTVSLPVFSKTMGHPDFALADLDHDGKKEMLVYQPGEMTGIDEISFYRNTATNKYQYAGKLSGGKSQITDSSTFVFRLNSYFDNFLNCADCHFSDTSDEAPIPRHRLNVKYTKGKLAVIKGDQELRSMINDNLGKFGERVTAIDKDHPDDGIRKEIAMNLAVYYYSFGKNMAETQRLFNKYYKLADAKKLWAAFSSVLQKISASNSF